MKALIAAGGRGTRLRPITYSINKHLFPIANQPMLFYALDRVSEAGIKEVAINVNEGEQEIQEVVGDGKKWGIKVTYLEQKGGALGLSHVVKNAKDWVGDDDLLFYLGDNIISSSIKGLVEKFEKEKLDCLLALSKVPDPERFGVPVMENGRILKVEEKPENPKSDLAVTGIYFYSNKIMEAVENIKPSDRGELEISDAHTYLIEKGYKVGYEEITGWWKDTGKPNDLIEGNALVLKKIKENKIEADLAAEVKLDDKAGACVIGKGTKISGNSVIKGPVVIGENCVIENAKIGPNAAVEDECVIKNAGLENSIMCKASKLEDCEDGIVDSLIGRECQITSMEATKPHGHKMIIGDQAQVEL